MFISSKLILRGINSNWSGKVWEISSKSTVGRGKSLEISIDDNSVSRHHAEFETNEKGWSVLDLGSTNGTFVNQVKLISGKQFITIKDIVQVGEIAFVVESILFGPATDSIPNTFIPEAPKELMTQDFEVQSLHSASFEDSLKSFSELGARAPKVGENFFALLQAGHYLSHVEKQDVLLLKILADTVAVLDAQRGAIALLVPDTNKLELKAIDTSIVSGKQINSRVPYSQSLAVQCLGQGESILYKNSNEKEILDSKSSFAEGAMASVMCILLRTPRRRLGILHLDRGFLQAPFTKQDLKLADAIAAQVSSGIECALLLEKQRNLFLNTVTILAQAVELRDVYTGGHTNRVTAIALLLAKEARISEEDIEKIRIGTPLHDIGKIGIDDAILRKPSKLTPEEAEVMKLHTTKGADIISLVPDLKDIVPIVRSHHERWDGKGYPDGLKGEKIPLVARVVAIADSLDAMVSDRPYRKGMSMDAAFQEIRRVKGLQFDSRLVDSFMQLRKALDLYPEIPEY